MDVCDTSIRKEDESCHQALLLRSAEVNVAWNQGSPGFSGRGQTNSGDRDLNNRKASHVATGSHQGHFTCWAKIQCSHNSNILMYSHFLNTKSFLLPTFQLF